MMQRWQRTTARVGKPRHGQGLVELALLMPLLALILLGATDLGRVYIDSTRLNNAVKEGAMIGLYQTNLLAVKKRAYDEVFDPGRNSYYLGTPEVDFIIYEYNLVRAGVSYNCIAAAPAGPEITVNACANPGPGDVVEVKGRYTFKPFTSEILRIFPANLPIRRTVRAVY